MLSGIDFLSGVVEGCGPRAGVSGVVGEAGDGADVDGDRQFGGSCDALEVGQHLDQAIGSMLAFDAVDDLASGERTGPSRHGLVLAGAAPLRGYVSASPKVHQ